MVSNNIIKAIIYIAFPLLIHINANASDMSDEQYGTKSSESTELWCPATINSYIWDGHDWALSETQYLTYTNRGEIATCEIVKSNGSRTNISNTWNKNGMLATQLIKVADKSQNDFTDSLRVTREYDEIVKSFITLNDEEKWVDGIWQPSSNKYLNEITRDDNGNVTLVERFSFSEGKYEPASRLSITYGVDNKADTISESHLEIDKLSGELLWIDDGVYESIRWDSTDGQIVSTDNLYEGSNRLENAYWSAPGENNRHYWAYYYSDGSYKRSHCEYWKGNYGYDESITYSYTIQPTDDNGSKKINLEINEEGAYYHYTTFCNETYEYDNYRLLLLEEVNYSSYSRQKMPPKNSEDSNSVSKSPMRLTELEKWSKKNVGKVIYDNTYGYPLEWTVSKYNSREDVFENDLKVEYSDYQSIQSVVECIESDNDIIEWYNLHGHKISSPTIPGLYIRREGSHSQKILVR